MSTHHSIAPRTGCSSVPQRNGSGSKVFAMVELEAGGAMASIAEPTLSSVHLRKLTVSVPAIVGEAIRAQLPLSS